MLGKTLPQRFGRTDARYRVRKFLGFAGYVAILVFVAILFADRLGRLSFTLGVVGAGVAVALQDLLASIAGAFAITFSRLFAVGDRIQVGETRGDVIDIGLLRTTLMETGNWVSRDMYNGRIVHIPKQHRVKGDHFQLFARISVYLGRDQSDIYNHQRLPARQGDASAGGQRGDWRVRGRGPAFVEDDN
jgi:hypothetical protein